ncbi:MAG: phosphoribosylaminoimidazolesuccinocarboxamide synthase [Patescibacteria group bacterium]
MNILEKTDFKNLGKKYIGKVRDVYIQNDKVILISTDRYSAFDRNLALIPYKGQVLTQISRFWFENTKDIVKNHVLDFPDSNVVVGKKCKVIPIEMVVRGYITGVTDTSLWTLYNNGQRNFGDFILPDGMKKNQKLAKPVLTPTTKASDHDQPLTTADIVNEKLFQKNYGKK